MKRLLATCILLVGLSLPPVVQQPVVAEDECFMFTFCWVTPSDSGCIDIVVCIIEGG